MIKRIGHKYSELDYSLGLGLGFTNSNMTWLASVSASDRSYTVEVS